MHRAATISDAAFISRTVIASWQDSYRDFLPSSFLASLERSSHHDCASWEERIGEAGSVTWIICARQGDSVGVLRMTIGASSIPGTDSELTTLYVLPQAQGQGLGSEALADARHEARRRAAPALGVCVLAANNSGNRFFARRGARHVGERIAFRLGEEAIMESVYQFG